MRELQATDPEPNPGAILLLHGETGTAIQRFFNDGLYHSVTGKKYTHAELFRVNPNRLPLVVTEGEPVEQE
jgi:hypothetical protein